MTSPRATRQSAVRLRQVPVEFMAKDIEQELDRLLKLCDEYDLLKKSSSPSSGPAPREPDRPQAGAREQPLERQID